MRTEEEVNAVKKAKRRTRKELEEILNDGERLEALPNWEQIAAMGPEDRARAAEEWVLQLHACSQIHGTSLEQEDIDELLGQKRSESTE